MSTKFGLLIDFDLLKAAISTNATPEIVLLRFGGHIALSRWRPWPFDTISGFAFVDIAAFRRSKSMRKPNFVDISQLMAEILLLPFLKNKRPPYWKSTLGFDFDHLPEIYTLFCIRLYRILSKSKHLLRKYDVISISQDGGRNG